MAKPRKPSYDRNNPDAYTDKLKQYYKDLREYYTSNEYISNMKKKVSPNTEKTIEHLKNPEKRRELVNKYKDKLEKETGKTIAQKTGGALIKFLDYLQRPQYALQNMIEDVSEGFKTEKDTTDNIPIIGAMHESARFASKVFNNIVQGKIDPIKIIKDVGSGLSGKKKNSFIRLLNKWNPPKTKTDKYLNATYGFIADIFVDPLNIPAAAFKPLKAVKYADKFNDYVVKGFKKSAKALDITDDVINNIKTIDDIRDGVMSAEKIAKLGSNKQPIQILKNTYKRIADFGDEILEKSSDKGIVRKLFQGVDTVKETITKFPTKIRKFDDPVKEIKTIIDNDVKSAIMPVRTLAMKTKPSLVTEILDRILTAGEVSSKTFGETNAITKITKGIGNLFANALEIPFPNVGKALRTDVKSISKSIKDAFSTSTGIKGIDEAFRRYRIKLAPILKDLDDDIESISRKVIKYWKDNKKAFKSDSVEFNTKLRNYIINNVKDDLPKGMKELGDNIKSSLKKMNKIDSAFFKVDTTDNYFPNITTPEFRDLLKRNNMNSIADIPEMDKFLIKVDKLPPKIKDGPDFLNNKVIDISKLDDINKIIKDKYGVKALEDDVVSVLNKRLNLTKESTKGAMDIFSVLMTVGIDKKPKDIQKYVKLPKTWAEIYKIIPKRGSNIYVPRNIFPHLKDVHDLLTKPKVTHPIVRTYDKITSGLKKWTLLPFGSYHLRNIAGNILNANLAGQSVPNAIKGNIMAANDLIKYIITKNKIKLLKDNPKMAKTIKALADDKTYKLVEEAFKYGVLDKGFVSQQILNEVENVLSSGKLSPKNVLAKTIRGISKIIEKAGGKAGKFFEDTGRLSLYKWAKKNFKKATKHIPKGDLGDTIEDGAARIVDMYLFDYSDLSKFEKEYMNRLAFFYTFYRKNLPMQIENILRNPEKGAKYSKTINAINQTLGDRDINDESIAPKWVSAPIYLGIDKDTGKQKIWNAGTWLPIETLTDLKDDKLNKVLNMLNPLIGESIELGMNYDSFFQQPIKKYSGEKYRAFNLFNMPIRLQHFLSNARILKSIDEFVKLFIRDKKSKKSLLDALKDYGVEAFVGKTYTGSKPQMFKSMIYQLQDDNLGIQKSINKIIKDAGLNKKELTDEEIMSVKGVKELAEKMDFNKALMLRFRQELTEDDKQKLNAELRTKAEQEIIKKRKARKSIK